jgi:UDP:flavonoid glycosyltransferase YjiC (YdhE family)
MMDALSLGLPMVMVPLGADQQENAQRCAEAGVARVVTLEEDAPPAQAIRDAAREVLQDPQYRDNARRLRKEIEALPGLDYPVALLERLATRRE